MSISALHPPRIEGLFLACEYRAEVVSSGSWWRIDTTGCLLEAEDFGYSGFVVRCKQGRKACEFQFLCSDAQPIKRDSHGVWLRWSQRLCRSILLCSGRPWCELRSSAGEDDTRSAEAYRLGLLGRAGGREEQFPVVSRKRMTKLQKALNPESAAPLARNKANFYRHCESLGLPVPATLAMLRPDGTSVALGGTVLADRDDWPRLLAEGLPGEFVAKPVIGALGRGVGIFTRRDDGFHDAMGGTYTAAELYGRLLADGGEDGMLLQQRLMNHPDLVRLTGTPYLQTVRVITLLDENEHVCILHAHLKVIIDDHVLDNSRHHEPISGVRAAVDMETGRLVRAVRTPGTRPGFYVQQTHPKTGLALAGFSLPYWPEVRDLVRRAALAFLPLRTIGWDIALCPDGPRVMEGNVWYDPPQGQATLPALLAELGRVGGSAEPATCDFGSPSRD